MLNSSLGRGAPVVLSGPSGVGKTTIQKQLLARYQDLCPSISATTRGPRPGEEHGRDYFFLSHEQFRQGIEEGLFLEWAEVHGNYYGTPLAPLEEHFANGIDALMVIDVQGGQQVREKCPEALLIFLFPPSREELVKRISGRGDVDQASMALRLKNAEWELSFAVQYDYWVINRSLDKAVAEVRSILIADRCRRDRARASGLFESFFQPE